MAPTTWTSPGLERPAPPATLNRRARRAACAAVAAKRQEYDFQQERTVNQWNSMSRPQINVVQEGVNAPKEAGTQFDALTFFQALRKNVVGTSCDPDGKVLIHLGGHFEGITVQATLAHGADP